MSSTLFTSKGNAILLGRELGRGGEGSVHEVSGVSGQVAKIYRKEPDLKKQGKLAFMAAAADAKLLSYVAWPQDTLHKRRGGAVVGFLMPRVSGRSPLHMVYSPTHRRQDFPKAAWDFLVYVARNMAASFETIHSHGHVIGDVNQSGVMVGGDTKVVLIDSDSFQIRANGTSYFCEVGVPHFTPPELQNLSSFAGFTRTTNHDNFGLAILIFHILFGGRHPFSGVPLRSGVGDALESDIKHFRYAYARDGSSRGIGPPPRSIPVSMLPESMEAMFHLAFTERGVARGRPTANQWVSELDGLRGHLRKCIASSMHIYAGHLAKCPWCALEQQAAVYFVDLGTTVTPIASGFVLTRVWALIEAEGPPATPKFPSPDNYAVKAQPLPEGVAGKVEIGIYRLIAICVAVSVLIAAPKAWFLAIVAAVFGLSIASGVGSSKRDPEIGKRRTALRLAQEAYEAVIQRAKNELGPEGFAARKAELAKLKDELLDQPHAEKEEAHELRRTAIDRQKRKFLEKFFIDSAAISGIGSGRKATLRSFGIETAADVSMNGIMQIRGFGWTLASALVDWRTDCERRFVFNPATAFTAADADALRRKYAVRRAVIEKTLSEAPTQLKQFRQTAASRLAALMPQLEAAARNVAQASADFSLL
jgi:DNA-binding helix-hairpin-helix protein with protein kinase domain